MAARPNRFDPELFPVESHWIDIDGCEVHYVDEGEGPTLLMLHGDPTWSFLYRRLIAGLSDRCRTAGTPRCGRMPRSLATPRAW